MAKTGNNAAYIQSRALEGDVSADMQYWNNDAGIRRREETAKEIEQYDREQTAKAEKNALYDKWVKPLNNYDTGSSSLNEFNGRILQAAPDKYGELIGVLEDSNASREEQIKARVNLDSLRMLPEKMKAVTDFYTNQHNSYLEGVKNGSVWKNEEYEKAFQDGFKNFQWGLDENMNPLVAFMDGDDNGVLDVQSYEQIKKGLPTFAFQPKANIEGIIDKLADPKTGIGDVEVGTDTGFTSVKTKGINLEALNTATEKVFSQPEVLNSALREYGLENTPENVLKIKTDFKNEIKAKRGSSNITDVDQGAKNSAARLAFDKSKQENEENPSEPAEIELDLTSTGNALAITPPGGGSGNIYSFSPSKPIAAGTTDQPIEIYKLFMSKDGKMSYTGRKKVGSQSYKEGDTTIKEPVYEDVTGTPLNESSLNTLSRLINDPETGKPFKNQKELVDHLKSKIDSGSQETKEEKKTTGTTYKGLDDNGNPIFE